MTKQNSPTSAMDAFKADLSATMNGFDTMRDETETFLKELNKDLEATALREAHEEVGLKPDEISIYRSLTKTYIPPSNFWVSPFIGITHRTPQFITNNEIIRTGDICKLPVPDIQHFTHDLVFASVDFSEVPQVKQGDQRLCISFLDGDIVLVAQ